MEPSTQPGAGELERRYAVILHADLVDYSRHLADDPSGTIATVEIYRRIVRGQVTDKGGSLIDFVGDNFLAIFDDAQAAMSAAIAVCTQVKSKPGPVELLFRMGLASGEVLITDDGRAFGDPVTIAARIQAITDRGGIDVSESVFHDLDEPGLRLRPLGPHLLKNLPGATRVYRLEGIDRPGGADRETLSDPAVAVLPMVSSPQNSHLAEAIRIDLLTALVRMPSLDVVKVDDIAAKETPAGHTTRYILESGLHGSGDRLRAYVQILDTQTVNRIWAHRWEGTTDGIFQLQDQITADVVRAMEVELVVGEPSEIYRAALDPASVDRVYRGWHELAKGTVTGFRNAVALFELIEDTAPDVPTGPALTCFARWYGAMTGLSVDVGADLARAKAASDRGIALDDPTGLSHMVRAALTMIEGGDLDEALAEARTALERRPTCDVSYGVEASIERYRGNWEAAVKSAQQAIGMSPTIKPWYQTTLAGAYLAGGMYREAADTAEPVVNRTGSLEALLLLAAAQQALGLERRAAATVESIRSQYPHARRADLHRSHPFQNPALLDEWVDQLEAAGMP